MGKDELKKKGKVYIIGVGPGDFKLITLKAIECIQKADVIVYDRLVNKKILKYKKENTLLIYVGKEPNKHTVPQKEINNILLKYALEGKIVTRVKGGDPFVFGRGAEEASYLKDNNVFFEIVPGITSAISVPAYSGIPVTHRDYASSFHVITGHEKEDKPNSLDYEVLAKLNGTLIFLMGVSNASLISERLIRYGKDPKTKIAIIENGTTYSHRTVIGTLETLKETIDINEVKSPSIIIVGEVVELHNHLNWFGNLPLNGKKIVITRPKEQADNLVNSVEELGGEAIQIPTIKVLPIEDFNILDKEISYLNKYNWIVFTSVYGVKIFFDRIKCKRIDIRKLFNIKIAAIGKRTELELNKFLINADYIPTKYTTKALIEGLKNEVKNGDNILFPKGDIANQDMINELNDSDIYCKEVIIYKTEVVKETEISLKKFYDCITFTSPSTVEGFVKIINKINRYELYDCKVLCIGPVTEKEAINKGFKNVSRADTYDENGLIKKLLELLEVD